MKVFLEDGDVPIDNSASERSIRPFTIGRKNFVMINTVKGAKASAIIYSIVQTAKLNNPSTYYYLDYLLTELPKLCEKLKRKYRYGKPGPVITMVRDFTRKLP